MSAYLIAKVQVHDPETYKKYTALTPATIQAYGGKFIARGGQIETLEGEAFNERLVIVEFPSKEVINEWYYSEGYQKALKYRQASSTAQFLVVDGVEGFAPDPKVTKTA